MTPKRQRVTDAMMLNYLERLKSESAPQNWVAVLYDGTLILDEPTAEDGKYDTITKPRPTIRAAIRAAIASEKRGGKRG